MRGQSTRMEMPNSLKEMQDTRMKTSEAAGMTRGAGPALGLSSREAGRRLEEYGPNILTEKKKVSPIKLLFSQFTDIMVIILMISTAISAFMGEMTEAVTIIAIVVLNAVLGFIQEYKTEKTMEALKSLTAPEAKVIRDGKRTSVPADRIVPGDVIVLEAGDRVAADAVLLEAANVQADESLLTGESVPVEKAALPPGREPRRAGRNSMVFMGTNVTAGRGTALVTATGMKTEMGRIADMIQNIEEEQTPLQKRLDRLGKVIAAGCLSICAVVAGVGIIRGEDVFNMLLSGISLAVAAVPEGLPALVTVSLALGVRRMLRRNALVRKLPAVETLGCAGVICSDKTGTLTLNKMTVRQIYADGRSIEAADEARPRGAVDGKTAGRYPDRSSGHPDRYQRPADRVDASPFLVNGRALDPSDRSLRRVLEIAALCNNAVPSAAAGEKPFLPVSLIRRSRPPDGKSRFTGDPTETALMEAAGKAGIDIERLGRMYRRTDEIPFDSERKCMSVVCTDRNGEAFLFTKGAPDMLLKKCSRLEKSGTVREMDHTDRSAILRANDRMAAGALRVIAVAYKKLGRGRHQREGLESDLVFAGLLGMIDPPRPEAAEAVRKCKKAGIRPVMITGDHKLTAMAIAKELDIYREGDTVLTGEELDRMDMASLEEAAATTTVYARVSPKHKLAIVRALRKSGSVVAMTGDGVNDAPAVKEADIGVAMGRTGTDVTKEASSMVLLDDNFATIVAAIEEGRVIYSNIRKFIRYMLSCNLGEVLTMFLGMLAGLPVPLLPIQILWVNLVTDGLPAVALGFDPPEKDIMERKPRDPEEGIFAHGFAGLIIARGVMIGLATLAVFASLLWYTADVGLARTGGFVTLVLSQLIHVFECKSETRNIFGIPLFNNMFLVLAVICSLIMILGVVYIPFLQNIFKTVPLGLNEWMIAGGLSFLAPVLTSLFMSRRSS